MPVYIPTGVLGSGKTLWAVGNAVDCIADGLPLATNLDLHPEHLPDFKAPVWRLPDFPTADDLDLIGMGGEGYDEKKWGWVILDEGGAWLNSRGWSDKGRDRLVKWLLHARKMHWNVALIIQGLGMLDKQVRQSLVEYHVSCRRTDRLKLPLIGKLLHVVSLGKLSGNLPKVHMASINYVANGNNLHVENQWYKSEHHYKCYDTDQALTDMYEHGPYMMLDKRHLGVAPEVQKMPRAVKPKLKAIELMMALPPDQRVQLARRYNAFPLAV
jgi:hypothetical protein